MIEGFCSFLFFFLQKKNSDHETESDIRNSICGKLFFLFGSTKSF